MVVRDREVKTHLQHLFSILLFLSGTSGIDGSGEILKYWTENRWFWRNIKILKRKKKHVNDVSFGITNLKDWSHRTGIVKSYCMSKSPSIWIEKSFTKFCCPVLIIMYKCWVSMNPNRKMLLSMPFCALRDSAEL